MPHARTLIRNAAAARLTGLVTTGTRVFKSRSLPIDPAKLAGPVLLVYCNGEPEIIPLTMSSEPLQQRTLMLVVRGINKANQLEACEDELDQIALEVEQALASDVTLGGVLRGMMQLETLHAGLDETLDKPCGVVELTYRCHYCVQSTHPETLL